MALEFNHRHREEAKAAKKDRRPAKKVPFPEAGKWNRETDKIEYPGYSALTLKKTKKICIV